MAEIRMKIRRLVADYIGSEGCDCCQGSEHEKHAADLAKALKVRKYDDGSGYDFSHYQSKPERHT